MYFMFSLTREKLFRDEALFSYHGGPRLVKQWIANEIICFVALRQISLSVLQVYSLREEYKQRQRWLGRINKGRKRKKKGF